jgi:hypothetical protein
MSNLQKTVVAIVVVNDQKVWHESSFNRFLVAMEEAWEEPHLPICDHDHPAFVSPDWPPPCELDQAVYRIVHDRYSRKPFRLRSVLLQHGYSKYEAGILVRYLLPSGR